MIRILSIFVLVTVFSTGLARANKIQENIFASVFLKDDKIGTIHLTTVADENGELEELRANASVTFLGAEVYGFTQNLTEKWSEGDLVDMEGKTDDDGTAHEISLKREADGYRAIYNKKDIDLPLTAFPTSSWHYEITQNKLLFSTVDFDLLKVEITSEQDTIDVDGKQIATEKFTFTGDWKAILWYDENKRFAKGMYDVSGRQLTVIVDQ
jgi:Domain of unknown function (DUF6134)